MGHGFGISNRVFSGSGIDDGDPAAPFEVSDQGGAEFGVGGYPDLIGRIQEELYPAFSFRLVEVFPDMMGDHDGMAAGIVLCIVFGAAEDLPYEMGNMPGMVGRHMLEDRTDEVILKDLAIKNPEEGLQGFFAACPLV